MAVPHPSLQTNFMTVQGDVGSVQALLCQTQASVSFNYDAFKITEMLMCFCIEVVKDVYFSKPNN